MDKIEVKLEKQLEKATVPKKYLESVVKNLHYNEGIAKHYERLYQETGFSITIEHKINRLADCNRYWEIDRYDESKVKDFIKTSLCKDKFCNNCKKVKQAARMARFMPEITYVKNQGLNIYQMVLTIPNIKGVDLSDAISKLFKGMATLIEYLKNKKKIKGIDFSEIGYKGAIRSLEVTYKGDEYHPHLHVLLALSGQIGQKKHRNKFSIDHLGKRQLRLFSDFEILIQKIWYLLMNGQKVTKQAIEKAEGYSCMLDEFKDEDFIELFKYMTKANGKGDPEDPDELMSYENFKTLYYSLNNVRQIQGYGCFFRIKDDDSLLEQVEERYQGLVNALRKKENPISVSETPMDLMKDDTYRLISRKRIYAEIRKLTDQ